MELKSLNVNKSEKGNLVEVFSWVFWGWANIYSNHINILNNFMQLPGYTDDIDLISRPQEDVTSSFVNTK